MGALPKPSSRRVNRNKRAVDDFRKVIVEAGVQPPLPDTHAWDPLVVEFWSALGEAAEPHDLTSLDWYILISAAEAYQQIVVDRSLLRIKEFLEILARYPFTPRDMQSLRVQRLTGDQLEVKVDESKARKVAESKARYSALRAKG